MPKRDKTLPRIAGVSGSPGPAARSVVARPAHGATIAVYSVKGGVGKTTIAANLAWCSAALSDRRTLLWDLDASGGAGFVYRVEPRREMRAREIFAQGRAPADLVCPSGYEGLDILPADESIRLLDRQFSLLGKRRRLAKLTGELGERYERIVLDCPPVMNEVSAQVVRAADLVIVPLPPSPLSARAFDLVVREVADNAKRHPPILPVHSMLDLRRALHRQALKENPDWPVIPYASVVEQSTVHRRPVGAMAPQGAAAQCFGSLWRAIEAKLAQA